MKKKMFELTLKPEYGRIKLIMHIKLLVTIHFETYVRVAFFSQCNGHNDYDAYKSILDFSIDLRHFHPINVSINSERSPFDLITFGL